MISLLRKELRALLPMALLLFAFVGVSLVVIPVTERPDEYFWTDPTDDTPSSAGAIAFAIVALIVAYSLFPREHDDGTIDFLHSLPIRRSQIFVAKLSAAMLVYLGMEIADSLVSAAFAGLNPQTFSGHQFRWSTEIVLTLVDICFFFIVLSHGVLLSFFRRFGLLVYGVVVWTISTLDDSDISVPGLNFLKILEREYHGTTPLIPWGLLGAHLVFSCLCLLAAYVLWNHRFERVQGTFRTLPQKTWGKVVLATATVCIAAMGIVGFALSRISDDGEEDDGSEVRFRSFESARFTSERYEFTYPPELRLRAEKLIQQADAAYGDVAALFQVQNGPKIGVDMSAESDAYRGLAGGQKILLDIRQDSGGEEGEEGHLRTLYHETAHVLARAASDGALDTKADSAHFFNEGLAEHVALKFMPDKDIIAGKTLIAAVSWDRLQIRFEELADRKRFAAIYNDDLVYSLGYLWVGALVEACGADAPLRALKALKPDDGPQDLEGAVLWRDVVQRLGCDLEKVNAAWQTTLRAAASAENASKIPRLSGGVTRVTEDEVIVTGYADRKLEEKDPDFRIRFRNASSDADSNVQTDICEEPRKNADPPVFDCEIYKRDLEKRRFEFQLGYAVDFADGVYYERWQSADIAQ